VLPALTPLISQGLVLRSIFVPNTEEMLDGPAVMIWRSPPPVRAVGC